MTYNEAKSLLKMSVVMWEENPEDLGTVLEVGISGFFVNWENGQRGWIDNRGAQKVSLYQPKESVVLTKEIKQL